MVAFRALTAAVFLEGKRQDHQSLTRHMALKTNQCWTISPENAARAIEDEDRKIRVGESFIGEMHKGWSEKISVFYAFKGRTWHEELDMDSVG